MAFSDVSKTKPIPVRLSDDDISRLDEAAARMGTNRAALIRYCADTFARYVNSVGKAALPLNWQEILNSADGRTRASRDTHTVSLNEETKPETKDLPARQEVMYAAKKSRKKKT